MKEVTEVSIDRGFWTLGAVLALIAVAAGAFGAHGLRARLTEDMLAIFETAARYQMYHSLGLIGVAVAVAQWPNNFTQAAGWSFVVGIVIFSGSLYVLALTGARWLGAITPIGGVAFLVGWACLALGTWRG
jgi:uncharacterized membrane protein YgdD (TMEM256/DUF423 family)